MNLQLQRVRSAFMRRHRENKPTDEPNLPELQRSTSPVARMTLLLRISTQSGPRTIIAPGIPLKVASEISEAMASAGHLAEFIDHCPTTPMADRLRSRRFDKAYSENQPGLAALERLKQIYS